MRLSRQLRVKPLRAPVVSQFECGKPQRTASLAPVVRAMPRGPEGEKRPADAIGAAGMVDRIATGEIEDTSSKAPKRAKGGK